MGDKEEIFSYAVMAALFLRSTQIEPQYMGKLTGILVDLENSGIQHEIFADRTAGGYFSRALENYFGAFEAAGEATSRNPVKLNEKGIETCREVIQNSYKESPKEAEKLLKILGLNLKQICS